MKHYIVKGEHNSYPRPIKLWLNKDRWIVRFTLNANCWYPAEAIQTPGINKIGGVSFGLHAENPLGKIPFVKNLINSIVIGWKPNYDKKDMFEIYVINDNRGIETRPLFTRNCPLGKEITIEVLRRNTCVIFVMNNIRQYYPMNTLPFGYYLGFYHGGKSPLPQHMSAELEILLS